MKQGGFTLLELLITIVVLAIIVGVAVPSYQDYIKRSYLSEAFTNLSTFRLNMEQSYLDNNNYGANNACSVVTPGSKHFGFGCQLTNAGQGFIITATSNGVNGLAGYIFTIDHTGTMLTTAFPNATVPANCWLSKAQQGC